MNQNFTARPGPADVFVLFRWLLSLAAFVVLVVLVVFVVFAVSRFFAVSHRIGFVFSFPSPA